MPDRPLVSISPELKTLIEGPVSVLVGTRDSRLVPEIARAWGPRFSEDRQSVSLCVPLATSRKTLDNLEANGQIAVAFAHVANYTAFQLKGRHAKTAEPDSTDLDAVERHRDAFAALTVSLGQPRNSFDAFWKAEIETSSVFIKIVFAPEQVFNQTPGPGAGRKV